MSRHRPRVALYIGSLNPGGSERHVVRLLESLPTAGFEVALVLNRKEGLLLQRVRELGVEPMEIPLYPTWQGRLRWLTQMSQYLRKGKFDILQAFNDITILYAGLAATLARTPVLVYGQRHAGCLLSGHRRRLVAWACRNLVTGILVNAEAARCQVVTKYGVPESKVRVVYNGIDLPAPRTPSDLIAARQHRKLALDRVLVGVVANLIPRKNVGLLIEAAGELCHQPVDFVIVGDGPQRSELEVRCRAAHLDDRFHFVGVQSDPISWIQLFDVGALPSRAEGLPNSVLEYMACGCPVVATAVDGTPELVVDQQTGILVPSGDARALAKAIGRLIQDADLRQRMGQAGRERAAQRFSLQQEIAGHVEAYRHWLNERN